MLVRSEKKQPTEVLENACPKCDGVGLVRIVPYGGANAFDMSCSDCLGEKVITPQLLERKRLGKVLTELLRENDLTMRGAAQKFSQSFREWIQARQGEASAEKIQAKIDLLKKV